MPRSPNLSIAGIQEVMAANLRLIAALEKSPIRDAVMDLHRWAVAITHVDTGALRASHRMEVRDQEGRIYIDPNSVNPRSKRRPAEYGVYEHHRGGSHAFYQRTLKERGSHVAKRFGATVWRVVKR